MTEEEAKTTTCCGPVHISSAILARLYAHPDDEDVNEAIGDLMRNFPRLGKCIGSACMAWRQWGGPGNGFCGLAGKP